MKTLVIANSVDQYLKWWNGKQNQKCYCYVFKDWHLVGLEKCRLIKLSGWQQGKSQSFLNAVHKFETKQANLRYAKNKLKAAKKLVRKAIPKNEFKELNAFMKRRNPVRKVSTKRAVQLKEYAKISKKWKVGKVCRICGKTPIDIHHSRGRIALLLLMEDYFVALCRHCHNRVKTDVEWSMRHGLLPIKGQYNSVPKEKV